MKSSHRTTPQTKKKIMLQKAVVLRPVVEAIRSCAAAGMPPKELKEKFGLPGCVISNIIHNHTYTYDYAAKKAS